MFAFRISYQRNRRWLGRFGLLAALAVGVAMATIPLPGADAANGTDVSPVPGLLLVPQPFESSRFAELSFTPSADLS